MDTLVSKWFTNVSNINIICDSTTECMLITDTSCDRTIKVK